MYWLCRIHRFYPIVYRIASLDQRVTCHAYLCMRVRIRQTCKNYVGCGNEGQNSSIHAREEQSHPYGMAAYHHRKIFPGYLHPGIDGIWKFSSCNPHPSFSIELTDPYVCVGYFCLLQSTYCRFYASS